ncbi:hypothetical protein DOY81_013444 [Sarcophaga bullata]|nr:hypothetical protein DOY81_013444 [Sarcophaga bullata]
MREERERFLLLKTNLIAFQAYARGLLARRRFQALMTPEMIELLRQKRAAKIIQRFWRGYRTRKRLNSIRINAIRQNIALLKETSSTLNSIKFKIQDAVRLLKGRFSASEALHVLMRLDRISRTVPHTDCRSDFISTFCYGIMAQAIRFEVDKQLNYGTGCITIRMLARYNEHTVNTFQEGDSLYHCPNVGCVGAIRIVKF